MKSPSLVGDYIRKVFTKNTRQVIDIQPHFVPLNLDALEITLKHVLAQSKQDVAEDEKDSYASRVIALKDFRENILNYVEQKHKNKVVITQNAVIINGGTNVSLAYIAQYTPAVVYQGEKSKENIIGVLYRNYNAVGTGLFSTYLNKELSKFLKTTIYDEATKKGFNYKKGFDIGHVFDPSKNSSAVTPLAQKLGVVVQELNKLSSGSFNIPGVTDAYVKGNKQAITRLKQQVDSAFQAFASRSHYGPRIKATLSKECSDFLLSVKANIVVIQDRYENQYQYGSLVESLAEKEMRDLLATVYHSKSIVEEMGTRIAHAMKTGGSTAPSKSKRVLSEIQIDQKLKVSTTSPVGSTTQISSNVAPGSNTAGISLVNLQQLINTHLQDVISANMGNGTSRNILNYRTGRFASSVKVERMSESRQGMITAFYSYMKHPYATFSAGGAQEQPKSRDPKLLISKSIREIVGQQVANRLRSVVV